MRKQKDEPIDMLQGTLDLLILRTLLFGPIHGHASENNRRARRHRLTAAGRKQLKAEAGKWERLAEAIARVLNPNREEA
jgi:PadR family transcriptional regulator